MKKLKTGILGMGYIGGSHIDAVRRIPECELWAVADANYSVAKDKAERYQIPKCYASIDELLADPDIEVIHNCTPNNLHTEINKKIIAAGKHLLSEKPLALNSQEAEELLAVKAEHPEVVAGVNFNYRMNPMVQEMRARVASGEVGKINGVHGCYLQDWLLYDVDYSWRLEPAISGPSCCVADIGSHWMDLVEHITGEKIVELVADLRTTYPIRKKPLKQVETFTSGSSEVPYEEVEIKNEDYASVMFRLSGGATGAYTVSEVSAGHGCYFQVEISGSNVSLMWNQEQNDPCGLAAETAKTPWSSAIPPSWIPKHAPTPVWQRAIPKDGTMHSWATSAASTVTSRWASLPVSQPSKTPHTSCA